MRAGRPEAAHGRDRLQRMAAFDDLLHCASRGVLLQMEDNRVDIGRRVAFELRRDVP